MRTQNLVIDLQHTLGNNLLAVDIRESKKWVNGVVTDEVDGWKVEIVLPERNYEKITVKVDNKPDEIIQKKLNCFVSFKNMRTSFYALNGRVGVAFRADEVVLKPKNTVES